MFSTAHLPSSLCEVLLRENITEERRTRYDGPEAQEETYYTADEYCMTVSDRAGIEDEISRNTAVWTEAAKAAELSRLSDEVRERRNKLLKEIDWTQTIDAPISAASREALRVYRQELRDITERPEFPYIVDWPQAPTVEKDDPDPVDEAFDILTGGENNA